MKQLVDEYFKRDLTDSEEQQLADWLESHPEDSARFAQLMKDFYAETGLPEPEWPHTPLPGGGARLGYRWLIPPALLLLLAFGVYFWRAKYTAQTPPAPAPISKPEKTPAIKHPVKKRHPVKLETPVPAAKHEVKAARTPLAAAPAPVTPKPMAVVTHPTFPPAVPAAVPLTTVPVLPLPPSAAPAGKQYERLSVLVNLPQGGLATVRIVDTQDKEIRALYAGILPAGQQTFTWDGKTGQGVAAPPGRYYVEIKSGSDVMRQEIHLKQDPTPQP